jgi:hypothetical protein
MKFFISSTFKDLEEHRKKLIETLLTMEPDVRVISMEFSGASPNSTVEHSISMVNESDIYIGILGWRYGNINKEYKMSITEVEYKTALAKRIPILMYLISEDYPILPSTIDTGEGALKIQKLRDEVCENHTIQKFTTPEDLARLVVADIYLQLKNSNSQHSIKIEEPIGPVGPEINPSHPFLFCHFSKLIDQSSSYEKQIYEIKLYIDLWYDEDSEEYKKSIASIDRVVYQLHETFPVPVIPMQNWRENWLLKIYVWGEFWVRATVWFKDSSLPPVVLLRYINISLPKTCTK